MNDDLLKQVAADMAAAFAESTDMALRRIAQGLYSDTCHTFTDKLYPAMSVETLQDAVRLLDEKYPKSERIDCILSTRKIPGGAIWKCRYKDKLYLMIHSVDLLMLESYSQKPDAGHGLLGLYASPFGIPVVENDELVDEILGGEL